MHFNLLSKYLRGTGLQNSAEEYVVPRETVVIRESVGPNGREEESEKVRVGGTHCCLINSLSLRERVGVRG